MCKSTDDRLYGQGDEIEADMYELDGHVRHFFSKEYTRALLNEAGLRAKNIETGEGQIYDHQSAFIKVTVIRPIG